MKTGKRIWLLAVLVLFVVLYSCTKQNEEQLMLEHSGPVCDTLNMAYSTDILPIIQANCYACHGNGMVTAGISLEGYVRLKRQVDNRNLVNVINHAPGYPQMPYGLPKLSDCNIHKIEAWVNRGAPEN